MRAAQRMWSSSAPANAQYPALALPAAQTQTMRRQGRWRRKRCTDQCASLPRIRPCAQATPYQRSHPRRMPLRARANADSAHQVMRNIRTMRVGKRKRQLRAPASAQRKQRHTPLRAVDDATECAIVNCDSA